MSFNFLDQGFVPGDSYSRRLDRRVAMDEYPYGYDGGEPPAGYANQGLIDDAYRNDELKRQALPWDHRSTDTTPKVPRTPKELGSFPDNDSKLRMKMGRK